MLRSRKTVTRFALLGGLILVLFHTPVQLRPRNFPADDSYFYLQVASEIAAGKGSTFNEITQTNGYHALWLGVCAIIAYFARGDKQLLLHLAWDFRHFSSSPRLPYLLLAPGACSLSTQYWASACWQAIS